MTQKISFHHAVEAALAVALLAVASLAHGQVYKCGNGAGKTIYSDAPCASGGKSLELRNDAREIVTSPTVCAQLLDERRRLAAEADRDAHRGRVKSASNARARHSLTVQYQRRCAGISRSGP